MEAKLSVKQLISIAKKSYSKYFKHYVVVENTGGCKCNDIMELKAYDEIKDKSTLNLKFSTKDLVK